MSERKWTLLASAVSAFAMFAPASAIAQDAAVSADADAAFVDEESDELVVTARRREENVQDVPLTVNVAGAEELRERRIVSTEDIQTLAPALRIAPQVSSITPNFVIRGQGRPLFSGALPSVVTYFSDVPLPQDGSIAPLYDLASVQVLKGPQGTLFGRNTTGGAILLAPQRPELESFSGYIDVMAGNYDAREFGGAVNIPLGQQLAARVAWESIRRDGMVENLNGGPDLDNRNSESIRASLLWEPTSNFENLLVYDHTDIDQTGGGIVLSGVFTDALGNVTGTIANATNAPYFLGGSLNNDVRLILAQQQADGPRTARPGIDPYMRAEIWGISNTSVWDVGGVTLKNIFGYRNVELFDRIDVDGTPLQINDRINGNGAFPQVALEQYTNEFQIMGELFGGSVDYIVGAFFLSEEPTDNIGTQARQFYRPGVSAEGIVTSTYITNESRALFGQGTYHFGGALDGLNITAGYRYTWDERTFCVMQAATIRPQSLCGAATIGTEFAEPSYVLSADYRLTEDALVYAVTRSGYRGGGVNTNVPVGSPQGGTYQPEFSTDYEVGFKTEWDIGGMFARFNAAFYRVEIEDIQVSAQAVLPLPGGGTMNSVIVANAAEAHTEGYEFEAMLQPTDSITIHASYEGFDASYDRFTGPPGFAAGTLLSQEFNVAPHTANIAASYRLPTPQEVGDVSFTVNYRWVDDILISTTPSVPNRLTVQPAYEVIDLRVDWRSIGGGNVDAGFFIKNLGDELYRSGMANSAAPFGVATSYYGDPFTAGVELRYNFGN